MVGKLLEVERVPRSVLRVVEREVFSLSGERPMLESQPVPTVIVRMSAANKPRKRMEKPPIDAGHASGRDSTVKAWA